MFVTSTNPAFRSDTFRIHAQDARMGAMTVTGTVYKTALLLGLVVAGAAWVWSRVALHGPAAAQPYMMGTGLLAFVCALATIFRPHWSPISAPIYAVLEGLSLGALSSFLELRYPGLPIQAAQLTLATLGGMLVLYRTGIIVVTDKLRSMLFSILGALLIFSLLRMVLGFFGVHLLRGSGMLSIGFSVLVCGVAAFCLLLDFERIVQGERSGAPQYMEWYSAFGLLVTLIWLYVEILQLLMKLQERDRR